MFWSIYVSIVGFIWICLSVNGFLRCLTWEVCGDLLNLSVNTNPPGGVVSIYRNIDIASSIIFGKCNSSCRCFW